MKRVGKNKHGLLINNLLLFTLSLFRSLNAFYDLQISTKKIPLLLKHKLRRKDFSKNHSNSPTSLRAVRLSMNLNKLANFLAHLTSLILFLLLELFNRHENEWWKKTAHRKNYERSKSYSCYKSANEPRKTKWNKLLEVWELFENVCILTFLNAWKWNSEQIKRIAFIWF